MIIEELIDRKENLNPKDDDRIIQLIQKIIQKIENL